MTFRKNRVLIIIAIIVGLQLNIDQVFSQTDDKQALVLRISQLEKEVAELKKRIVTLEHLLNNNVNDTQPARTNSEGWRVKLNWRKLESGMSKSEVINLLDEAINVTVRSYGETCYYPDVRGGRVSIDSDNRVDGWREP